MLDAVAELRGTEHGAAILGDFEMQGVTEFRDSAVVVRGRIKTLTGSQWGAGRAYNEIIKRIFDERGINMPFPHRTTYFGGEKEGHVVPLRLEATAGGGGSEGGGAGGGEGTGAGG